MFRYVVTIIDTDHDGVISKTEQRTYAELVLGDLSLSVDGDRLRVQLVSTAFPRVEQMMEGLAISWSTSQQTYQAIRRLGN